MKNFELGRLLSLREHRNMFKFVIAALERREGKSFDEILSEHASELFWLEFDMSLGN